MHSLLRKIIHWWYFKSRQVFWWYFLVRFNYTRSRFPDEVFLSGRCLHFIPPFGRFYKELKEKSSLSLYILPFTLSLSLCLSLSLSLSIYPFHISLSLALSLYHISLCFRHHCVFPSSMSLSLSLSVSLSLPLCLLSIFLSGVSNGHFRPCY